jgi:hypothetical protein
LANWLSDNEIKKRINEIRDLTGDKDRISLITITESLCPDCEYNEITHESKDSSCSTCGGIGKLQAESAVSLLAKVRWVDEATANLEKIGYLPRGGAIFTVDSIYESNLDDLTPIDRVEIDGITVIVVARKYKGFKNKNRVTFYAEITSMS